MMKIGVLSSSRADYGIYQPLLRKLKEDKFFRIEIIAFGTHLSKFHGYTIKHVEEDGYDKIHRISTVLTNDNEEAVSTAYGLTVIKFAHFWNVNKFDLVFCLGDRYEMSAAVQAAIPFRVKLAHIHGGETTLGAIDNVFRHQITHAATLHFTSTSKYRNKVSQMLGTDEGITTVGSLSLDGVGSTQLPDEISFRKRYGIPEGNFILITFHPETVSLDFNLRYAAEMKKALSTIANNFNLVITMPNADTLGSVYREALYTLKKEKEDNVILIENFGKTNYFAAMKYARLLLGNTSSGIIEAASFNKYVVNVGARQKGRAQSLNVLNCDFDASSMKKQVNLALKQGSFEGENIYFHPNAADAIIKVIKTSYYAKP